MPKCVFTQEHFHWHDDRPLRAPWSRTVIYEAHVRGFTMHPNSGVEHPGTYRGLMEKIPYLKELGVTAVELMPVHEFNEASVTRKNPQTGRTLRNYWGYDPVAFFAPKASYSSLAGLGQQKLEFKEMVQAFHKVGIEVILDVVLNHTAEGNELGPTLCFRGMDNAIFYTLEDDKLLKQIAEDPILSGTKLIAEAWDASGAYEVGSFQQGWAEWNGRYRDDVRRFWRGDDGMLGSFASRICGSADIYAKSGKCPERSVNFITCHDGFTLNDLVSYRNKHNEANGESNRDGTNENLSENYGVEGVTDNAQVESIRKRQIKNFLLTLLISHGVPMLLGGDELRRTQGGNNNAYCQDNETSWVDWTHLERHQEIYRFARGMIAFRRAHPVLSKEQFYTDTEIKWFNSQQGLPNWADPKEKQFACLIHEDERSALYLMFNASTAVVDFGLPRVPSGTRWHLAVDTSREAPQDLFATGEEPLWENPQTYHLTPRSSAILLARATNGQTRQTPLTEAK